MVDLGSSREMALLNDSGGVQASFAISQPLDSAIVTVNGTPDADLRLKVFGPNGNTACDENQGGYDKDLPAASACIIHQSLVKGQYTILIGGTPGRAYQLVTAGYMKVGP